MLMFNVVKTFGNNHGKKRESKYKQIILSIKLFYFFFFVMKNREWKIFHDYMKKKKIETQISVYTS